MDFVAVAEREGKLLAATARGGRHRPVPTCPGWTVRDVVAHIGQVHRRVAEQVRERHQQRVKEVPTPPDDDDTLFTWYEDGLTDLLDALAAADPAEPVWTWKRDDRTAGFWRRRMAHETTVHRVDVQSPFGDITHVDDDVAGDGIDEVLDAILVAFSRRDVGGDGRTSAVRTGESIWRVTPEQDRVSLDRDPGPAGATVSGEPSELYLWLWGRRPDESVRIEGDRSVATWPRGRIAQLTG